MSAFDSFLSEMDDQIPDGLPVIQCNDRDLGDITSDALAALVAANDPPKLFRHGTTLTRLQDQGDGVVALEAMSRAAVRGHIARAANWRRVTQRNGNRDVVAAPPPLEVVEDLMSLPAWPRLPRLDRLVTFPTVAPNGQLQTSSGYHAASHLWYQPGRGFAMPDVPERPSTEQVGDARRLICEDLLGDFPFVTPSDAANAVALLMLPVVRDLIDGPTPLHLIEAPSPGTGKGLLSQVLLGLAHGRSISGMSETGDAEEWRKRLTSLFISGRPVVLIDNVRIPLDSAPLAAALTLDSWEDRLLGANRVAHIPIRVVWVATGNNPIMSSEIARRTIRIRLDANQAQPWLRSTFRYPELRSWAADHHGELTAAVLTLVMAWIDAGRPNGQERLGSYEQWSHAVGGMLDVAGIPGFLGNLAAFYEASDQETRSLSNFVTRWWEIHEGARVGVSQLMPVANMLDPPLDLGQGSDRSRQSTLGRLLSNMRDRCIGEYRVVNVGQRSGAAQWKLEHSTAGRQDDSPDDVHE